MFLQKKYKIGTARQALTRFSARMNRVFRLFVKTSRHVYQTASQIKYPRLKGTIKMEIERKWIVKNWPQESDSLPLIREELMRQGYISVHPTVRIREESVKGGNTEYIVCFKSSGTLSRKEIELSVSEEKFRELEDLIGIPLIPKRRRTYLLPDGLHLEVNLVDEGRKTEFMYAEIEYTSEQQALSWDPASAGLKDYLSNDVTGQPDHTMGTFWVLTRLKKGS